MGPKRVKRSDSHSDEDYAPKKEDDIKIKLETKEDDIVPMIVDTPRYVHDNPREFKGRLGYACINSYLRKQKPSVFSARTCRLDTVMKKGHEYVRELALLNIADMKTMIQWNEDNNIKFMRISSDIFPFASHEKAGYNIDFAKEELASAGALAKKYNHRLTMHPGQYNQLVSLTPKVVANTIRELDYHAQMLDLMGLDQDAVMIIHMGGVYGDRESALARFEKEYVKLPENIKRRLVLENDEMGYSVTDLLPICTKLGIPLVLDWHHHHINPGNTTDLLSLLPQINKTWTDKGIKPKQHYSESRKGAVSMMERRAHSDRVQALPPTTDDVDLMIEAKDKEQAVFHLYKLFGLHPVNDEVWIEADDDESTQTKGRKSAKSAESKKRTKEEADLNADVKADPSIKTEEGIKKSRKKAPAKKEKIESEAGELPIKVEEVAKKSRKKAPVVKKEVVETEVTVEPVAKAEEVTKKSRKKAPIKKEKVETEAVVEPSVEAEEVTKKSRKKAPAKKEKAEASVTVNNEIPEVPVSSTAIPIVEVGRVTRQRSRIK